jgi:hypothetical protein
VFKGVPLGRVFRNLLERGVLVTFLYERRGAFSRPDSHLRQKHTVHGGQQQLVRVLARDRD